MTTSFDHPTSAEPVRRPFFRLLTLITGAVAATVAGIPILGSLLAPKPKKTIWVSLGLSRDFPEGETRLVTFDNPLRQPWDGMIAHTGVYVRNEGSDEQGSQRFLVLAVNCAHLGCPVSWFPQSGLFMCPCHGGVYYADGAPGVRTTAAGLFRCAWRVENERVEIQAPHYPTLQDTLDPSPQSRQTACDSKEITEGMS